MERDALASAKFQINSVYYQWGIKETPAGAFSPMVSSWVYRGVVHRPGCSSKSCDVPEHFHLFQDFAHIIPGRPLDTSESPKILLCNLDGGSMLTWDELKEAIADGSMDDLS